MSLPGFCHPRNFIAGVDRCHEEFEPAHFRAFPSHRGRHRDPADRSDESSEKNSADSGLGVDLRRQSPQHVSGRSGAEDKEYQRRQLHETRAAEHDVASGPAERQHGRRGQPRPERQHGESWSRRPLQRRPHERSIGQAADQPADGQRDRSDVQRKKEGPRHRGQNTIDSENDEYGEPHPAGRSSDQVGTLSSSPTSEPTTHW
jgi:hypothetical protein